MAAVSAVGIPVVVGGRDELPKKRRSKVAALARKAAPTINTGVVPRFWKSHPASVGPIANPTLQVTL
jgi:hypothetical protein